MEAGSSHPVVDPLPSAAQVARRRLMLRDGLKFLTLTVVATVLCGLTTLLFRSFEAHREQLGIRWSERGRDALRRGESTQAVSALRVSLSYHPDDRENQIALAYALAASGHTSEAENYYLNLWQARPGDGLINLQLARLERSLGRGEQATEYYRAAIFGTWAGDAPARRRDVRLELASFLVERGQRQAAEAELLIAAGNNPDPATQLRIGEALESAGDAKDALTAYRNVSTGPQIAVGQAHAGALCYKTGDYICAQGQLEKALHSKVWTAEQRTRMEGMQRDAVRLGELDASQAVPPALRAAHLLTDAHIAERRAQDCANAAMRTLQARWKVFDSARNRAAVRHDEEVQEQYRALIFETESAAAQACGAPSGDDALLLRLQAHPITRTGAQ